MLKKDIIILGCIGIIILCLSKLVVDSYNAASNSGNQEKESIEENLSAEALQELSEKKYQKVLVFLGMPVTLQQRRM